MSTQRQIRIKGYFNLDIKRLCSQAESRFAVYCRCSVLNCENSIQKHGSRACFGGEIHFKVLGRTWIFSHAEYTVEQMQQKKRLRLQLQHTWSSDACLHNDQTTRRRASGTPLSERGIKLYLLTIGFLLFFAQTLCSFSLYLKNGFANKASSTTWPD